MSSHHTVNLQKENDIEYNYLHLHTYILQLWIQRYSIFSWNISGNASLLNDCNGKWMHLIAKQKNHVLSGLQLPVVSSVNSFAYYGETIWYSICAASTLVQDFHSYAHFKQWAIKSKKQNEEVFKSSEKCKKHVCQCEIRFLQE